MSKNEADKLNNEIVDKTGVKKRMDSLGTLCESRAFLSRLGGTCEDPSCEGSEETSLLRDWRGWEQRKHAGVVVT